MDVSYRSGGRWRRGAGERHDLLDGEAQLEAVKRVADADLALDLGVGQSRHDGTALHISTARRYVPRRHPDPQLREHNNNNNNTGQ